VRVEIGSDIEVIQWKWPIGHPRVGTFGDGLYEARTAIGGNIYRVLFCLDGNTMVLLHGFMKKTQATPQKDLELARKRQREARDP
jgi:phage-related protein